MSFCKPFKPDLKLILCYSKTHNVIFEHLRVGAMTEVHIGVVRQIKVLRSGFLGFFFPSFLNIQLWRYERLSSQQRHFQLTTENSSQPLCPPPPPGHPHTNTRPGHLHTANGTAPQPTPCASQAHRLLPHTDLITPTYSLIIPSL